VDTEVKRILDEAHERAREILEKEGDLLERIAQALLDRETLDHDEIQLLAEGKPLPPMERLIIPGLNDEEAQKLPPVAPSHVPSRPEAGHALSVPAESDQTGPDDEDDDGSEEKPVSPLADALARKTPIGSSTENQEELDLSEPEADPSGR
jgi:cell division protease FtsH